MLASVAVDNYAPYAEAAAQYRPKKVRVLFIQESPPYAKERHFYFTGVTEHDDFWLNLMRFLYRADFGEDTTLERQRKGEWLKRFQRDGYWTIDASHDSISKGEHEERTEIIRGLAPERIQEVRAIKPEQVVLVKKSVFDGLNEALRAAGLPVVNDVAVPYPGRGQQTRFAKIMGELVASGRLKL